MIWLDEAALAVRTGTVGAVVSEPLAWVIRNDSVAISRVAVRLELPEFACTVYVKLFAPLPLLGLMLTQLTGLVAVQGVLQPEMLTEPLPPLALTEALLAESV